MKLSVRMRRDLATLAAFLPFALCGFLVFLDAAGESPIPRGAYEIHAVVPTSVALSERADVRIGGVDVGHVEDIAARGRDTVLLLDLKKEHAPLYRNATVDVRLRTLVGENYVELERGTPRAGALPSGATLSTRQAVRGTQVDEILSALDARTRGDLRRLLDGLGGGLRGHGDELNRMLGATHAVAGEASPLLEQLRRQRAQFASLVDDSGRVMAALGRQRDDIGLLARRSTTALRAFAEREEQVVRVLEELPPTLRQASSSSANLARFSGRATPVLRDLRVGLDELAPVVSGLRPAAAEGRKTMAALKGFATRAAPMIPELTKFADRTSAGIPAIQQLLAEYNPFAAYFVRYTRELGAFFGSMRSITNIRDATGNMLRVNAVVTPSTYAGFTPEMEKVWASLRDHGAVSEIVGDRGINAYPDPGTIGDPRVYAGEYPRLRPLSSRAPRGDSRRGR